jgi:ABC-type sugar transport system permease subunit
MKKIFRFSLVVSLALLAFALALALRSRAANLLPIDYDEDDYLAGAQRYAAFIRQGDWQGLIDYDFNYEHPPLTKIVYGLAILPFEQVTWLPDRQSPNIPPASSLPEEQFDAARRAAALLGALTVGLLALLNPLAGLALAMHTWTIKYTSQIMLEALPALSSLLAVLCYLAYRKGRDEHERRGWGWLGLSALFLGITAASKYLYCVAGIAILVDWGWREWERAGETGGRRSWRWLAPVVVWGVLALAFFFAFNPRLWNDPVGRLSESVFYHGGYAQSEHVRQAGFPTWQPLVWLAGPVPWHPGVFLLEWDFYLLVLAVFGFGAVWRKQRVMGLWLALGMLFLLLWPTKWPQYVLTLTAPLSLATAQGFEQAIWQPLRGALGSLGAWLQRLRTGVGLPQGAMIERSLARRDLRRAMPWLLPGLVTLSLIALFPIIYQAAMALTDFNAISIRDGIQGGVWRAVWNGLTGQEPAAPFDPFDFGKRSNTVHYAGPFILAALIKGGMPDLLVFNVVWTVLAVVFSTAVGLLAALLLNQRGARGVNLWRAIFILPWAIPEFVGALVWLRVLEPRYGWLAVSQQLPAGVVPPDWLDSPERTLVFLLIAAVWGGFPFVMLAALAGLKMISDDVYDAAAIDGAGVWMTFRHVTWPLLLPLLAPAMIIRSVFAFNQFYLFYAFQVNFNTMTLATLSFLIFSPSFGGQFAVSAALNIFTVLVLVLLIVWFSRVSKAAEGVTYA